MTRLALLLLLFLSTGLQAQVMTGNETINNILEARSDFYQNRFTEEEWDQHPLGFNTERVFEEEYEFNKKLIDSLQTIDTLGLNFDDLISYKLLRFTINNDIKLFEFREYLNPILSESGFHTRILGRANRAYRSKEGLNSYLAFLNDIPRYFDENIALMRKGLEIGFVQPLEGLQNYEATYDPYIVNDPETSVFWKPFTQKPSDISDDEWQVMLSEARTTINESATRSFRKLKTFFEEEYFPNARPELGASSVPNGKEYYEYKVKYYTTLDVTPDEVHEMGLEEVTRIKTEMEKIIDDVGFDGSMADFFEFLRTDPQFYPESGEDLLKEASFIAKKVDGRLPSLFGLLPRQPYGVVPVPDYLAPNYTGGRYSGAPLNSDRGGQYWVNTYNLPSRTLYTLPALTLHEAMPGHHLQIALTAEMESLPTFRRNMYINAFGEGWGLYAEYLGHELGIYETPYELFGRYTYEMWRACRLVIDTGIHYKGWTRDQAVTYLAENSALSIHEVNTEINRYITWPGQALAYKVGEMTIKRLREKTETELGDDFDVKEYHDVVLSKGTVTMSILEEIVDKYIAEKKIQINQ
jgi:uncharacterized protein (DUF885 family)